MPGLHTATIHLDSAVSIEQEGRMYGIQPDLIISQELSGVSTWEGDHQRKLCGTSRWETHLCFLFALNASLLAFDIHIPANPASSWFTSWTDSD